MIRLLQIVVLSCAGLLLTGCNAPEKNAPLWQQVKIGDLAPSDSGKLHANQSLKTINLIVYVFEIPAENISALDNIWQMLHTKPLRFNDYDTFGANSFLVGFGQVQMWNKIRDVLRSAGGRRAETTSLLLSDGQANDLTITVLSDEQTIFYTSTEGSLGSLEAVTIGPGRLALRIKAEKIPGSRGVCNLAALPVFSPPISAPILQLAAREKSGEFLFTPAGFQLKMSPDDFFFLGPEKYISHQRTLGSLFFSTPDPSPIVRAYLLVCIGIND